MAVKGGTLIKIARPNGGHVVNFDLCPDCVVELGVGEVIRFLSKGLADGK